MSLVTTCPACATQFFVTQVQLAANRGKVRCGQCKHVFNGNENLNEVSLDEVTPKNDVSNTQVFDVHLVETVIESSAIEEDHQRIDLLPLEENSTEHIAPVFGDESPSEIEAVNRPITESSDNEVQIEASSPNAEASEATQLIDFMIRPESAETKPSQIEDYFTTSSKLNSKPTKKMPRWLAAILIIILLPLGILQSVYYFRTVIASQLPQTKFYLVQACALAGCKVELPKKLELLTIDDSEMREDADHDHVLQFSITLLNKANVALAYPSIELTLTDANDDTVIRRTFKPNEYLEVNQKSIISHAEVGFAAKDRLKVKLALNTNDVSVAGYRLELVE